MAQSVWMAYGKGYQKWWSSGVSLYLKVKGAAALMFDEGELGNH